MLNLITDIIDRSRARSLEAIQEKQRPRNITQFWVDEDEITIEFEGGEEETIDTQEFCDYCNDIYQDTRDSVTPDKLGNFIFDELLLYMKFEMGYENLNYLLTDEYGNY